jgi:ABC-type antimicrobial peptide transport system permease subunit
VYQAVGKLKAEVDLTRAQTQMRTIGDALARQYPQNRLKNVSVIPLQERLTGNLRVTLWALMSAVGVVWLIACANIANLLLARATGRTREIALRAALGAGRSRVMRQLLTESCVLAGAAGLSGLLLALMFETLEEQFDDTLAYPRFRTQVVGLFAGVAALLAAVGIFSVLAYIVGHRTREIAVRRALGARAADVVGLIVGQGLRLVAIGLVLGLAGALAVARMLTGLLYEISPWDVGAYLGTIAVLGGAALLATLLPGIRAATIPPVIVLQQE